MIPRSFAATLSLAATVVAISAVPARADVRVGTSGWTWGNPTPTGSDIDVMGFSGARGYAAGEFGTLLRTDDGGATWTGLPTGLLTSLTELQVITPDVFVVGGGCTARRTTDGGKTFTRLYFNSLGCKEGLAGISFTSATNGYLALVDGTILFSSDGGATWTNKIAVPGTPAAGGRAKPTDISFATDAVGVALTTGGKIYRTSDGGGSWTEVSDTSRSLNDVTMVSASAGFAVGDDGLFLTTADGGVAWSPKASGAGDRELTSITAASASVAIATNQTGDFVLRTVDGGTSFARISALTQATRTVAFSTASRVVAAGVDGAMAGSDDGGATFTAIGTPRLDGRYSRIRSAPGKTAFATGENGQLARTTDGGKTWSKVGVPTSEDMLDISFPSAGVGYALDTEGKLFKSGNGGTSWANLDTGTTARPGAVYAPTGDVVLLVGPTGVRRSSNGAETFDTVRGPVARASLEDYDAAGAAIIVWGRSALLRSTDRGKTWTKLALPGKKIRLARADFVTAKVGFVRDIRGRLFTTRNGGTRWTEVMSTGTDRFVGMSFASATVGFLIAETFGDSRGNGYLMRTENGGKSWAPQLVTNAVIPSYGAVAGPTSYVLAGTNLLLYSTTGGKAGDASTVTVTPSSTRLKKPGRMRVTIKVKGARGGDVAVVSGRRDTGRWVSQEVELDRGGRATTSWDLRRGTTAFVGQWAGNEAAAGAGSAASAVRVR